MKVKRWFFFLLLFLLLINIGIFIVTQYTPYEKMVKNFLIRYIEARYDLEISIESMILSDRQIKLTGVMVKNEDSSLQASINYIYVNYNLFEAIFANFRLFKTVESITIQEPIINLNFCTRKQSHLEKSHNISPQEIIENLSLPDISGYFKKLNLSNGTIEIDFESEDVHYTDVFNPVNITINNNRVTSTNIIIGALNHNDDLNNRRNLPGESEAENVNSLQLIEITADISDNTLSQAEFIFHNYQPDTFSIRNIGQINGFLNIEAKLYDNRLSFQGNISESSWENENIDITAENINLYASNNDVYISSQEIQIDNIPFTLESNIADYLSYAPILTASLQTEEILSNNYHTAANGVLSANITAKGIIYSPDVNLELSSDSLKIYSEVVKDLRVNGRYYSDISFISIDNAIWQDNLITGHGHFSSDEGLVLKMSHNDLSFTFAKTVFRGDNEITVQYEDKLKINTIWNNLDISHKDFVLRDMKISVNLDEYTFYSQVEGPRLKAQFNGNIHKHHYQGEVDLQRFNLNNTMQYQLPLLKSYPFLTGKFDFDTSQKQINITTGLEMTSIHQGHLAGNLTGEFLYNTNSDSSYVNIRTSGVSYNFEPLSLNLLAYGSSDSLRTHNFNINEELFVDLSISNFESIISFFTGLNSTKHYADQPLDTTLELKATSVDLNKYLKYFLPLHTANNFSGQADLELLYHDELTGSIDISGLNYNMLGPYNNKLTFFSAVKDSSNKSQEKLSTRTKRTLFYNNELKSKDNLLISQATGYTHLNTNYDTSISAEIFESELKSIIQDIDLNGKISSQLEIEVYNGKFKSDVFINAYDIIYNDIEIDSLLLSKRQNDNLLTIEHFEVINNDVFYINAHGEINYNIFTREYLPGDESLSIEFSGDLLKPLSKSLNIFENGYSDTFARFSLSIEDEGLSLKDGKFKLSKGEISIINQIYPISKIEIDLDISDNVMHLSKFSGVMGEGVFLLRNEVQNDINDFQVGMLNLGRFFIHTPKDGISIHLPRYLPQGTTATIVIKGREQEEAEIIGPFDSINIIADCYLNNVSILYPPETDNLFKIINIATERRTRRVTDPFPFSLDLLLIAENQVKYVTYPLNLLVTPESYLHLLYQDGRWIPADALITSESGNIEIFGTSFTTDYANLVINYQLDDYRLRGYFYKFALDGSNITLNIYNETDQTNRNIFNNLNFSIESDNPEDRTIMHILSKLRYNRRLEDIPKSQQNSLLQDEFLQIAGLGLSGAFIDPFIHPVENRIRQFLNLDFFSIKTGFVENIVRTYTHSERDFIRETERETVQWGRNILLNNLSVTMGKFLAHDFFLDYEFLMQKPVDVAITDDLYIYHNFTFHYNLPLRMRLAYRFYLKPVNEPNSHEIFIRRSFSFW